jgi:hypothetical protein
LSFIVGLTGDGPQTWYQSRGPEFNYARSCIFVALIPSSLARSPYDSVLLSMYMARAAEMLDWELNVPSPFLYHCGFKSQMAEGSPPTHKLGFNYTYIPDKARRNIMFF